MKSHNSYYFYTAILMLLLSLQGCQLIADIFTAGFWVGIVIAVLVLVILVWLVIKGMKWLRK